MRMGWIVLALATLCAPAAHADVPAGGGLKRCVTAAADRADFSGAVLVARGRDPVVQFYRGRLSTPDSGAIDRSSRFNIGSTSKMFTAVAIGQLIERGKLRLDEPIGEAVSGLTPLASRVTVRQLLDHSSGLGDFFAPENMAAMLKARRAGDLLPLVARDSPQFQPGTRFSYSNTGYALLGIAIERVTGMTYGEYLRRNVFAPAEMADTGPDPRPLATLAVAMTAGGMHPPGSLDPKSGGLVLIGPDGRGADPSASSSAPASLRPAPGAREAYGSPAGGLFSTAEDMAKFAAALRAGRLLSVETLKTFTAPQIEVSPPAPGKPARYYGLGFGLVSNSGILWVGHNGGTLGANAEIWFAPAGDWTIVVLSNRDPPQATEVMRRIRASVSADTTAACG